MEGTDLFHNLRFVAGVAECFPHQEVQLSDLGLQQTPVLSPLLELGKEREMVHVMATLQHRSLSVPHTRSGDSIPSGSGDFSCRSQIQQPTASGTLHVEHGIDHTTSITTLLSFRRYGSHLFQRGNSPFGPPPLANPIIFQLPCARRAYTQCMVPQSIFCHHGNPACSLSSRQLLACGLSDANYIITGNNRMREQPTLTNSEHIRSRAITY